MTDELERDPAPGRTGWETEHLDDPADDAERHDQAPGLDTIDRVSADGWRMLAEQYRRDADYWRQQYDGILDEVMDLRDRVYGRPRSL